MFVLLITEIMELLDFILSGSDIVAALLLLLPIPNEEELNKDMQKVYNDFMKIKGASKTDEADELILLISNDGFDQEIYQRGQNWGYLATLKTLKEKIVKFYFTGLKEIQKSNSSYSDVRDVYLRINKFILQLMRLRMVINPDYRLSKNKHPQTGITYLVIKSYWLDDRGVKIRKFSKSIGREDNFIKGIDDEQAIEQGLQLIQPTMFDEYKDIYPE